MKKTLILSALGALALAQAARAETPLTLGFLTARSGPFVSLSRANPIAVDIAVEQINAKGGINGHPLRIVPFDTAGDARQAALGTRHLAEDEKALAIIGPFSSSEVRTAFPAGDRLGITQMAIASSAPGLARPFRFAFRNTTDESVVISRVLDVIAEKKLPAATGAAAYATDDIVSKSIGTTVLPAQFASHGITLKGTVSFQLAAFDLASQVSQLAVMHPDLVGLGTPPDTVLTLAKEMNRQGIQARIIGGTTVADPQLPARMAGIPAHLTIGTTFFQHSSPEAEAFTQAFAAKAKAAGLERTVPNQMDAVAYDIVYLYATAMRQATTSGAPDRLAQERDAIRNQLSHLHDVPALEGNISVNADHDTLKPVYIMDMQNGAWTLLGTRRP